MLGLILSNTKTYAQVDTSNYYDKNLIELSQISVVSETKTKQKITEVPATVRVITKEQIKNNAYFTLEEALASLPGFQFRNILGLNSYIFQRGITNQNNKILILIDGIQINELNSGGFYAGGQYNLANVKQIEVIYGPASVVYGTNAVSGIIYIITKAPSGKTNFNASTLIGTFNTFNTNASFSHNNREKKISLIISGMIKSSDKADLTLEKGDNYWTENMEIFEKDYAFDAKLQIKNFIIGTNIQNRQSSTSTHYPSVNTIYQDYGSLWNLRLINNYIKYKAELSEKLLFNANIYNRNATILGNSVKIVTDTGQIAYFRPNNLTGTEFVFDYNPAKLLNIITGLFAEYETLANEYSKTYSNEAWIKPDSPKLPETTSNILTGGFLQARLHFLKYFKLTTGVRFDYSTAYNEVFTPRVGIIFNKNKFTSKLLYAEAFRAPKPWDYTDGEGNPDLQPEKLRSFEVYTEYYLTNKLKAEISIYNNYLFNALKKVDTENSHKWENTGNITTDGAELCFSYGNKNLNIFSSYTYNYSYDENNNNIPEIAKHSANLGFNLMLFRYFNLNINANYFGKRKNTKIIEITNSEYIEAAIILNTTLSVINYKNADIRLIIKNLTDAKYYHTSNLTPDRYRQAQRMFMLQVGYNFNKK